MRLPDRGLFPKYSKDPFVIGCANMKKTTLTAHDEISYGHSVAIMDHTAVQLYDIYIVQSIIDSNGSQLYDNKHFCLNCSC